LKISNDLIGLSLQPTDNDSDILYFSGLGTSNYHSLVTNYQNIFVGDLKQNQIIVNTESNHNLQINDLVEFDIQVGISKTFKVEFNSTNRRIVINAKDIQDVNIENNTVIVESHEFKTGQKLIYETTNTIGGLINNQIYYAVIIDDNTIKLSQYLSDSKKESPVVINLTSSGSGRLMPINPEISILKYQNIIFDISDESLAFRDNSAFELKFYEDEKFNNEFLSAKITKNGQIGIGTTSTIKLETTNLNKSIYYNFVPLYSNSSSTQKLVYVDSELGTNNKISIEDSILNSTHKVVGGGLTSFIFTTVKSLEHAVYDSTNSNLKYYTNSRTSSGPISKISVNSKKKLYNNLPYVKDIISSFGENAILESESSTIGKIKSDDIKLDDYGFNYSIDRSIRPKYKFPDILRISPLYVFDRIEIIDNGKNYISPPNLIAIDPINGNLIEDVILYYDFDLQNVQILKNTQGIGKFEPIILPVNNDNGITISFIEYDSLTNSVTVTISAEYNNINDFPFSIGDLVIIEDVLVEEGGKGYNSEEYNYKPFVIDYIDPNIGGTNGSIRFSLNDYLLPEEYPGIYDNRIVKGKIVPQSYFPKFKTYLKRINFLNNEEVKTLSNSGFVVGFDFDNNILRVSTDGEFSIGETIVGQSSNIKAIIVDIFSAESYINVGPNVTVESGFNKETGLLNNDRQRLHDNDYYQYFSYSVESETDYSTWSDEVDRLNHTAGFKKFSNLNIQQADSVETGLLYNQDFGNFYAESLSPEVINLNCYHDFDLVTENSFEISSKLKSNEIYFESRIISDYIESKGNRVLLIDDISDKFTTSERRPYQVIDQFEFLDIRFKKYFIHIMDVLDPSRSEFSVVSLLNSQNEGYINNYAIISSEDSIGYYDYTTSLDRYGQLIYYPTITDRKIYKFNIFSYDIGDVVGAATTTLFIGDIGNVSYVTGIKTENSTQPVSLVGLTTTRQDSCKYLVTITDDSNSYYEYYELNTVNDNGTLNVSMYGDLSTGSPLPDVSVGLVTFSSEIQNDNIVLNVHPSQTSIASSFRVNAVVTSIASTSIQNGSVEVGGNLLQSNFISTSITGPEPEKKLIFSYSSDFTSTYNLIVINDKTNNEIEFLELTTLLNNTNQQSFIVEYGNLSTNNSIGIFECEISDLTGDYELYFTPNQNIDYEMRILKALIGIEEQTGIAVI
jgi:hypothetical protein